MNGFEAELLVRVAAVAGVLLVLAGAALTLLALRRQQRLRARINRLERDLGVFTEASTRVAQTLDQMLLDRVQPGVSVHASRRYLLQQARERLAQGDSVQGVARGLGLSHDEVSLLERQRAA